MVGAVPIRRHKVRVIKVNEGGVWVGNAGTEYGLGEGLQN